MRIAIVDRPLDAAALLAEVSRPGHGAEVLFVGTVRDMHEGRGVDGIEYTAYRSMAERELAAIAAEAEARTPGAQVVVEHRLGTLTVGEASVVIAAAHARRDRAYEASRYVIEQLKQRVPIWKREHYVDGTREWVHAGTSAAQPVESAG